MLICPVPNMGKTVLSTGEKQAHTIGKPSDLTELLSQQAARAAKPQLRQSPCMRSGWNVAWGKPQTPYS